MSTNLLNKPYPFIESSGIRIALAFIIGVVVFLLLNTYRPFGIEQIPKTETVYVAGFGVIAFIGISISLFSFPMLIDIKGWTIKSEVSLHLFNWLLTSTLIYFYNSYFRMDLAAHYSLPKFMSIVAAVYLVPLMVMIFLSEKYHKHRNEQAALTLQNSIDDTGTKSMKKHKTLTIQPETSTSPNIELETLQFLFATSDGNYILLHYLDTAGSPCKELVRLSLKNLDQQLQQHSEIIRCHKSYLVNKEHIREVFGNARSLYLKLSHLDIKIPVSRSFDRSLLS